MGTSEKPSLYRWKMVKSNPLAVPWHEMLLLFKTATLMPFELKNCRESADIPARWASVQNFYRSPTPNFLRCAGVCRSTPLRSAEGKETGTGTSEGAGKCRFRHSGRWARASTGWPSLSEQVFQDSLRVPYSRERSRLIIGTLWRPPAFDCKQYPKFHSLMAFSAHSISTIEHLLLPAFHAPVILKVKLHFVALFGRHYLSHGGCRLLG